MESPEALHHLNWMREAAAEARKGLEAMDGGPFGAIVVQDGKIVGRGHNTVTRTADPTAHAEINAIRDACRYLGSFQLTGCTVYTTCEPCPMCLGALYWARPDSVYFAALRSDAAAAGFDDQFIYDQVALNPEHRSLPFRQAGRELVLDLFQIWKRNPLNIKY